MTKLRSMDKAPKKDGQRILCLYQEAYNKEPYWRIAVWNNGIGKAG